MKREQLITLFFRHSEHKRGFNAERFPGSGVPAQDSASITGFAHAMTQSQSMAVTGGQANGNDDV